ncbi:hypothetical protein Tco_0946328 [Tanacetum coccineum]
MDQAILKSHVEKPKKFKGSNFRCWQQNMLFYLTSLHVSYVLTDFEPVDPYLVDGENVPTEAQMADYERAASQWNHNEYNCRNYVLNALDDSLYDIYSTFATIRDIWESLEKKYMTQVACSKKFVVGKFLNFKMNDAKPVVKQVEELQIIVHEMEVEGMGINSNFLVGSIIEKLPQSWKNFKLYLKHLTDDMSFEQLVLKIRVEEDNRMIEKADANSIEPNANLVKPMFMGNGTSSKIKGKGKVILKLTSGKDLVLSNMLYVPNINNNLISGPILSNKGFKLVIESDKFVITKGGVYVGKGYLDEELFKLSVVTDDNVINNNNAGTSTAILLSYGILD